MSQATRQRFRSAPWLLRRADQAAVGTLTLIALVAVAGYWTVQGGGRGGMIEIDRAEPRHAAFEVDLNAATWPELAQLPDVGEVLAKRIVESRETEGPFLDHDGLRRVRGIGPKTLNRIRPYLRPMASSETIVDAQSKREPIP